VAGPLSHRRGGPGRKAPGPVGVLFILAGIVAGLALLGMVLGDY